MIFTLLALAAFGLMFLQWRLGYEVHPAREWLRRASVAGIAWAFALMYAGTAIFIIAYLSTGTDPGWIMDLLMSIAFWWLVDCFIITVVAVIWRAIEGGVVT